ncbi:Glutamate racemase [Fructilactobacillus florum 8D]|uniref:Glutamate racemase n=1 Tax=Fructilactobacillus florum 8D TaxID=1221538 RepID=W9ECY1_9LACO|nr:glutamate racemase [Fructilactobacillus florum]ETO39907.1 Glutamate racemase [Fructilactobacillus florum 8D]
MQPAPIAMMDSGVGGLTVLKTALRTFPQEQFLFLGDEQHLPYGEKSPTAVRAYSSAIGSFFVRQQAKLMIVACNTATSVALASLQNTLPIPVIGVIEPGSRAAVQATRNHQIGVIATRGTVASHAYRDAIHQLDPTCEVVELACPKLIPLVEAGNYQTSIDQKIVRESLAPLLQSKIDTLILGCTHFPIISSLIQQAVAPQVRLIDPGIATIATAQQLLENENQLEKTGSGSCRFYTTANPNRFAQVASQWLNRKVVAQLIDYQQLQTNDK